MRKIITLLILFKLTFSFGQVSPEGFAIEIEPMLIEDTPGIHSFAWGRTADNKWVIVGGRIDGLHRRQPFAAFLEADNNKYVFVIDPHNQQVWNASLAVLDSSLFEQLQSTNQEFYQRDTMLYVIGGYGYSASNNDHITFPYLTAIDINGLAEAVISNQTIIPFFRQVYHEELKVTGGQLGYIDSTFYLVGGQLFDGRYNPMGPNMGPGFVQEYTNEIRTFQIVDDGVNLNVVNFLAQNDSINLHRRDYNMAKQIFPDGQIGFTVFSGVFDSNDMPFLNTVDVKPNGYVVNPNFNQFLSQYHSAKVSIYDVTANCNHTLFFGGMAQFYYDDDHNLIEDQDVPFVKTISKVSRFSDGSMTETALDYIKMPRLLGAGAEFIPIHQFLYVDEVVDLNAIPNEKTLIGYIYGGIESSARNIFFTNNGSQSNASNTIYKVYINKAIAAVDDKIVSTDNILNHKVYPNPAKREISIDYYISEPAMVTLTLYNSTGKMITEISKNQMEVGAYSTSVSIKHLDKGTYVLRLFNGKYYSNFKFVKL